MNSGIRVIICKCQMQGKWNLVIMLSGHNNLCQIYQHVFSLLFSCPPQRFDIGFTWWFKLRGKILNWQDPPQRIQKFCLIGSLCHSSAIMYLLINDDLDVLQKQSTSIFLIRLMSSTQAWCHLLYWEKLKWIQDYEVLQICLHHGNPINCQWTHRT